MLVEAAQETDFLRWVPHPEVWLLVGGLVGLYVYAIRVIGPKAVPAGTAPVTRSQLRWFSLGIVLLWLATDWPVHDVGEQYLYSVHMAQHTVLTMFVPPIMLMATPEWLARLVVGNGRVNRWVHTLARPVPACFLFNAAALILHWQLIVNTASGNGGFHYGVHALVVTLALLLWIPVCGPFPELRISPPAQMLYLFITSIVPTVPAAWLIFAEGAVYSVYDIRDRMWEISVTADQQVAGTVMKLGAGTFLWVVIAVIFFRWAGETDDRERGRRVPAPDPEPLTFDQVQQEFEQHPAPPVEPTRP